MPDASCSRHPAHPSREHSAGERRPAAWRSIGTLLASGLEWQLLGFAISFAVIAAFWRVNHRIMSGLRAVSPGTIVANLAVLRYLSDA
ncbi:TMEM175 family protein [Agromyces sp. NPDC049794]|uniref:TMEM175 family protein n=1 Tax=unclassified Agromyces TaxID=2639701 RepID=UPI0033FFA60D